MRDLFRNLPLHTAPQFELHVPTTDGSTVRIPFVVDHTFCSREHHGVACRNISTQLFLSSAVLTGLLGCPSLANGSIAGFHALQDRFTDVAVSRGGRHRPGSSAAAAPYRELQLSFAQTLRWLDRCHSLVGSCDVHKPRACDEVVSRFAAAVDFTLGTLPAARTCKTQTMIERAMAGAQGDVQSAAVAASAAEVAKAERMRVEVLGHEVGRVC